MKAKQLISAAAAVAMTLAAVSCGSNPAGGTDTNTTGGDASQTSSASGSALNVMLETPVESLDPQVATDGTSFEVIADLMDGLMQMDADGKAVNALCESYEISPDGKKYTFKIRSDAK